MPLSTGSPPSTTPPVCRPLFSGVDRKHPTNVHPVIRTHPASGRKGIFVKSAYATRIVGLPTSESDAILRFLYAHYANPDFHVRFRWRVIRVLSTAL
jgi:taurine dioxygenase